MIKDFRHKDLENIHEKHTERLRLILGRLNASASPHDMNLPGLSLHELIGNHKGTWVVKVSDNYLLSFTFSDKDAYDVNCEDYH